MLPWAKVNPSVQRPTQRTGNQGQRLGPQSHRFHWAPPSGFQGFISNQSLASGWTGWGGM